MVNEMSYRGLKPGQYIQMGGSIKSVTDFNQVFGMGPSRNPSPQTLAAAVSWMFIALRKRRAQINQTPVSWHRGDNELADEVLLEFDPLFQMARIDKSVELNRVAYLHKLRSGAGRMVGLRWLDPDTIEPDSDSVDMTGYTRYWRNQGGGRRIPIPATDIIRIYLPGLRELAPDVAAGDAASLDAQIVRGMAKTLDGFFETGGLPVLFVDVPGSPLQETINQLKSRWQRVLRREGDGTNKMIITSRITSGPVTVTPVSLAPEKLDTTNIDSSKAEAILATFGVPAALVHKDVNRAEAELKSEQFADDIVGRLRLYLRIINSDKDVKASGLSLVAHPDRMEVYQRRRLMMAQSVMLLTGNQPIMTSAEARQLIDLESHPDDVASEERAPNAAAVTSGLTEREVLNGAQMRGAIDIIAGYNRGVFPRENAVLMVQTFFNIPLELADKIVPTTPGALLDSQPPTGEPSKAWLSDLAALRKFVSKGNHYKRWFNSNELSDDEIMGEIMRLDPLFAQVKTVYP